MEELRTDPTLDAINETATTSKVEEFIGVKTRRSCNQQPRFVRTAANGSPCRTALLYLAQMRNSQSKAFNRLRGRGKPHEPGDATGRTPQNR